MTARRRNRIEGQFAPRTIEMLRSPAFQALSLSARRILDRLEIELADHGGVDNGKLPVTYADLRAFGIDHHAIAPALRELEALGFVEVTVRGRAGSEGSPYRTPSLYRLTYRHTDRANPTDDWRRCEHAGAAAAIASAARRSSKNQNSRWGKNHRSGGETNPESQISSDGETSTQAEGESPLTIDISGRSRDAA